MLEPLPPAFGATREGLHALAEHVLAPARYRSDVVSVAHDIAPAGRDFFFLLARQRRERASPPAWTCRM